MMQLTFDETLATLSEIQKRHNHTLVNDKMGKPILAQHGQRLALLATAKHMIDAMQKDINLIHATQESIVVDLVLDELGEV